MRRFALGLLVAAMVALGCWLVLGAPPRSEVARASPLVAAGAEAEGRARVEHGDGEPTKDAPTTREEVAPTGRAHGRGGLDVRVTLAPEGAALPHVAVRIEALDGRAEDVTRRVAVTDAAGLAQFDALAAGRWQVRLDRGPEAEVEVVADPRREVTLTVPAGTTALTRVRSADGALVAGADVTLWGASGILDIPAHEVGVVVGKTDAAGELFLAGLAHLAGHGPWVAAHHPGFGTSLARMVDAPVDANDTAIRVIELRLDLAGSLLELRVTDEAQRPLSGALALTHPVDRPSSRDDGNGRALAHVQRRAPTDAHGVAHLGPLAAGDYQLRVQAMGHATFRGPMTVDGSTRLTRDVALAAEARVHGHVTASDGRPVARVLVAVQVEPGGGFAHTGPDGHFELGGLAAGPATWLAAHDDFVRTEGTLALVRGEVSTLTIRLTPLARLHGRLVDGAGRGLDGWSIRGASEGHDPRSTSTDSDGVFALRVDADTPYALRVVEPGSALPLLLAGLEAVRPGPDALVIRVPDETRATSFLEGTLVDAAERPAIAGQYLSVAMGDARAYPGRTSHAAEIDAGTGSFRLGPFPPGTCTLTFAGTTTVEFSIPDIRLVAGSTTHLGRVVVPASGILRAELQAEAGFRPSNVLVQLDRLGDAVGDSDIFRVDVDTLTATKAVLPGRYRAKVYGTGFRGLDQSIDVVADQTTTLRGTLRPATRFALRLHMPPGEHGATFVIRDATGAAAFELELDADTRHEDRWPFLDRGTFEVEATGKSGRLYRTRFTVDTLERRITPFDVRVEVR